jgi:hypothetical protein
MDTLEITLAVKRNGVAVPGLQLTKRIAVDEFQSFVYEAADAAGYVSIPSSQIDTVQALVVSSDQAVTVRLNGQSDAGLVLNAGGLLVMLDGTLNSAVATNTTISNSSGNAAIISGFAGGT